MPSGLAMAQGILDQLKHMSLEDKRTFDRWLKANTVVGFVFAAALVTMAHIGSDLARSDAATVANNTKESGVPVASESAVTGEHADEATEALYPGRYVASCRPGPMVGCLCDTGTGQASIFPQIISDAADAANPMQDHEFSQMVQWLRVTCASLAQSKGSR
jgi:hypothetical protein